MMAEMHTSSNKKYTLKKIRDCWFLENSYTRATKRLPFLSEKVKIELDGNYIFADNNVYEIKETDSGDTGIEKIDNLVYSSEQKVDSTPTSFRDTGINEYEGLVKFSEQNKDGMSEYSEYSHLHMKDYGQLYKAQREETDSGDTGIEKIDDLIYSSVNLINEYEDLVKFSEQNKDGMSEYSEYSHLHMKDYGQLYKAQREAFVTFQVILNASKLAKVCKLRGKMELRINEDGCSFYNTKSKTVKYTISNSWIRWFGTSGATKFCFEVGRRCPAGEGQIVVTTDDSSNLLSTIKRIWDINGKQ